MHALVLAGVGLWCFASALAGGLVGLVLGNIRLPAFLFVASHPAAAAGANIGVSGVAAATASVTHVRAGRIDRRLVLPAQADERDPVALGEAPDQLRRDSAAAVRVARCGAGFAASADARLMVEAERGVLAATVPVLAVGVSGSRGGLT